MIHHPTTSLKWGGIWFSRSENDQNALESDIKNYRKTLNLALLFPFFSLFFLRCLSQGPCFTTVLMKAGAFIYFKTKTKSLCDFY